MRRYKAVSQENRENSGLGQGSSTDGLHEVRGHLPPVGLEVCGEGGDIYMYSEKEEETGENQAMIIK